MQQGLAQGAVQVGHLGAAGLVIAERAFAPSTAPLRLYVLATSLPISCGAVGPTRPSQQEAGFAVVTLLAAS